MAQGKHSLQQHDRILNEGEKLTKLSNSQDRVPSDVIGVRNKIIIQEGGGTQAPEQMPRPASLKHALTFTSKEQKQSQLLCVTEDLGGSTCGSYTSRGLYGTKAT